MKIGMSKVFIFFLALNFCGIAFADSSIRIFGLVKDIGWNPVKAYVGINDENWNLIQGVETDASGYYEISVPRHSAYNFWIDSWVQKGDYRVEAYIPQKKTVEPQADKDNLELNFTLKPAGNIIVRFYDENGKLVRNDSFRNLFQANNWVTTLDDLPTDGLLNIAFDKECAGNWHNALPAFIIPLNEPVAVHILYEVPGFGKFTVIANNDGEGYRIDQQSAYIEINLNYEIAKSEISNIKQDFTDITNEGCKLSSLIAEEIREAETYLQEGIADLNDSNTEEAVQKFEVSLQKVFSGKNKLLSEKEDCYISKYRKGKALLFITDDKGKLVPNIRVSATQKSHDFLFGCNAYMLDRFPTSKENQLYKDEFKALFNYATLPFYWSSFEPEPNMKNFSRLEHMANWCLSNGILPKGHPLIWHQSVPIWLPRDVNSVDSIVKNHVQEIVKHFRNTINTWDVINESTVSSNFNNQIGRWVKSIGPVSAALNALQWADESNPQSFLILNDFNISSEYEDQLQRLVDQHAPLDAIGIQSHMHTGTWPLEDVWQICERYGRFGKPIHFTEVTVLSGALKTDDDWDSSHPHWDTTPEGEASQAEYVEALYRLLFSHPMVQAITWWDFSDQGAWQGAPAGLVRKNLSPKPAYKKLLHLIKGEWWTSVSGFTDQRGKFSFEGFGGNYDIKVEFPSSSKTYSAHVYERKTTSYKITPSSITVQRNPTPDVRINGSDETTALKQEDTLTLDLSLNNNGRTNEADWWCAVNTPFGLFFLTPNGWSENWEPLYQGPLFQLDSIELFNIPVSGLPEGTYAFYFGIDTNKDGEITWDSLYIDVVEVDITE